MDNNTPNLTGRRGLTIDKKGSWQTAETAVGRDPDSPEMGTPGFVAQSIAATATTRPTSIEAIGWAQLKRER